MFPGFEFRISRKTREKFQHSRLPGNTTKILRIIDKHSTYGLYTHICRERLGPTFYREIFRSYRSIEISIHEQVEPARPTFLKNFPFFKLMRKKKKKNGSKSSASAPAQKDTSPPIILPNSRWLVLA